MLTDRPSSKHHFAIFMFWLVAIATQININHVSNMVVGTGWFVNLGLVLCSIFLVLSVRTPLRRTLGLPGYLIVAALVSYLVIGGGMILVTNSEWRMENHRLPLAVCFAIFVIVASALGASAVLRRFGIEYLLARILVIKAIVCILILANPLMVEYLYHAIPEYYRGVSSTRFSGPFYGPNHAGPAACQAVALSLSLLSSRHRGFAFLVAILGSAAVILTFSRAAILILVLVFLFFLWSRIPSRYTQLRTSAALWLVSIVVIGSVVLILINLKHLPFEDAQISRLEWIVNPTKSGPYASRFYIWPLSVSYIAESPVLGHGLSQFHHVEGAPVCHGGPTNDHIPCGTHSTYLLLLGEAGIIPLIFFVLFIGSLFRAYLTLPKSMAIATVTGWTIILAMESMFSDDVPFHPWNAFIIGLSCALVMHVIRGSRERSTKGMLEARNQHDVGSGYAVQGRDFRGQ